MDFSSVTKAVIDAGKIILDKVNRGNLTKKGERDFVTDCDIAVQTQLAKILYSIYPDIPLMSEEKDNDGMHSDTVFILDPIDGTTNYIHGYDLSCISLACVYKDEPVYGAVYNPFSKQLYLAEKDKGATLNGKKIKVSDVSDISSALIGAETSPYERCNAAKHFDKLLNVFLASMDIRISGSAALDICYVAEGKTDAFLTSNLKPWDYAAACCILKEAGGICTDWKGELPSMKHKSDILATNSLLQEVLYGFVR